MKITEEPKETIISIAQENKIWQWLTVLMSLVTITSMLFSYSLLRRPQIVWMVTEEGKITNSIGKSFEWEVRDAAQKAVELFYVPSLERDKLLDLFFSDSIAQAGRNFKARDRFVSFKSDKVEQRGAELLVQGTLFRENEREERLNLVLSRTERTEENPFGLAISSSSSQIQGTQR